jgi:DNA processing protein
VLFYKGNLNLLQSPQIAIVGTRNSSAAGLSITKKIAADLGASGFVITSGLARGIDTEAHKATLKTGTIAVVAGGLDVVYPPENKKLYDQIAESGLIIGENPIGTEPLARHFPQRNRIIAGLAKGVLVVEAAKKSGSMITADYALREGREVFAVPGSPLDPRASGTNYLIKNGAVLVEDASDIIDNLGKGLSPKLLDLREEEPDFFEFDNTPQKPESANSNDFINFLSQTPVTPDELALRSGASISIINQTLLELEMDGKIERHIGGKVCLKVA